ncbi:pentatricopeptide repeat-containing protein 2, mitochondrial isoform X1 [Octopus sinensis]|uniref:Pentatricopeptide repeat-containing protein 2, mitochondrial isoform X1 n=1 Tax=Octopus sinensis TaxID=2607531 RepID=A0A7E6EQB3_9MOLL|nr:pentatricopeptide repeat-containing protein 2, mitochondrial isoform X1 [Octopus sinensis]
MATRCSLHVLRRTCHLYNSFASSPWMFTSYLTPVNIKPNCRHLFSQEILGLDNYQRQRILITDRLGDLRPKFIERMKSLANNDRIDRIFTDDLKTMAYIAAHKEEIELVQNMLIKYHQQDNSQQFNTYSFGPVVLRLLYIMKDVDTALKLFESEETRPLFSQVTSYIILMDMLYESKQYDDTLKVFQIVTENETNIKYPNDCTTIAFATYYALNTAEALQNCQELLKACLNLKLQVSNRALVFAAMLALKQEQPAIALEMISLRDDSFQFVLKNLKALCYAKLNRIEDTLPILRSILQCDSPYRNRQLKVFPEVVNVIHSAAENHGDPVFKRTLETIELSLRTGGLISDVLLEEFITQRIVRTRQPQNSFKARGRSTVDGYRSRQSNTVRSRSNAI